MSEEISEPSTNEDRAREIADGILSQLTHELRGTTEKGSFHMAHFVPSVVKFRAAIASAIEEAEMREREACAKIVDDIELANRENGFCGGADAAKFAAASIRSRPQKSDMCHADPSRADGSVSPQSGSSN